MTIVVCGRLHERYFVVDCVVCCGMKNLNALAVVGFHIPSRKALYYGMLYPVYLLTDVLTVKLD